LLSEKKLQLISLVETGVRQPEGLQGNIEYIPFERAAPEKAFSKLLEMIKALLPGASALSAGAPEMGSTVAARPDEESVAGNDFMSPRPDWDRDNYKIAYVHALFIDDDNRASEIEEKYLATEDAASGRNRAAWQAFSEYRRILMGKSGNLAALERLADINKNCATPF
jgi:hypothetical protein